jgi:hypothetical protein
MDTGTNAETSRQQIPHQRAPHGGVAVVVGRDEERPDAVLYGAHAALERGLPLELVLPHLPDDDKAPCMAAMDRALLVARTVAPRLEVRVHLGAEDLRSWIERVGIPVDVVVVGRAEAAQFAASDEATGDPDDPERAMLSLPGCEIVVI